MTTLREAAQQALDALDGARRYGFALKHTEVDALLDALRAALAEPVQEPVAWMLTDAQNTRLRFLEWQKETRPYSGEWIKTPLYTSPPQRKPLTEEEIDKVSRRWVPVAAYMGLHEHAEMTQKQAQQSIRSFARAIEKAHGIE